MNRHAPGKGPASQPKKEKGTPSKSKKASGKKSGKLAIAFLSVVLTGVLTVLVVGGYMVAYMISVKNGEVLIDLNQYKNEQNQTTILYANDANGQPVERTRLHGEENRIWVDIGDMPEYLWNAAVALEDKRFWDHHGVDWIRTIGVLLEGDGGGSTITQQLIKNLTGNKDVTYVRKFTEICTALNLTKNFSQTEILETYLNTFYLGEGCYGVETAAETYFGKSVKELNLAECATLVSITQEPYTYDPLVNPEENKVRQEQCLKEMYKQGKISKEEYEEAVNTKLVFTNSPDYVPAEGGAASKPSEKKQINSYFTDYVIDRVVSDLQAAGYVEAEHMIYYGGLKIYTTESPDVQAAIEKVYQDNTTAYFHNKTIQSSMIMMDYEGKVVGVAGGRGEKTANRTLNRAVSSPRPTGSSIKPLSVYSPAIEAGLYTWSSIVPNAQIMVKGQPWPSKNDDGSAGGAPMTLQRGLSTSTNMIAAQLLQTVGVDTSFNYTRDKFHLSLDGFDRDWSPLGMGSQTYGVKPIQMAAAFASFGNGGKYYEPYCYYKVTDSTGQKVYLESKPAAQKTIAPDTADVMNELLQTVVTGGTGTQANVSGFKTFGKTGTTDSNKDRWFVGGTPYYVAAVWYGYDQPDTIGASRNPSANIFGAVMNQIHKSLPAKDFQKYGDAVQQTYCTASGGLASPACASTAVGWYKKNVPPPACTTCGGAEPVMSPNTGGGETSAPGTSQSGGEPNTGA